MRTRYLCRLWRRRCLRYRCSLALALSEGLALSWTCSRRVTQSPCFAGNEQPSASQLVVSYSRLAQALLTLAPFDSKGARTASATEFVVVAIAACVGVAAAVPAASECAVCHQYWQPCNWTMTMATSCHRCLGMRYIGQRTMPSCLAANTSTTLVVAGDSVQPGVL